MVKGSITEGVEGTAGGSNEGTAGGSNGVSQDGGAADGSIRRESRISLSFRGDAGGTCEFSLRISLFCLVVFSGMVLAGIRGLVLLNLEGGLPLLRDVLSGDSERPSTGGTVSSDAASLGVLDPQRLLGAPVESAPLAGELLSAPLTRRRARPLASHESSTRSASLFGLLVLLLVLVFDSFEHTSPIASS